MTEDQRAELALATAELLKARSQRQSRRAAVQAVVDFFDSQVTTNRGCETMRSVLDAEYAFRDPEAHG